MEYLNPLSPCGERHLPSGSLILIVVFQSTFSMRRKTAACHYPHRCFHISIHFLHAEKDFTFTLFIQAGIYFNPLSPCGERQNYVRNSTVVRIFQSTFSMRRKTPLVRALLPGYCISIHFLHAEKDEQINDDGSFIVSFQSTFSMRRKTISQVAGSIQIYFNPLSPCGERQWWSLSSHPWIYFNPLSPCGERPDSSY